MSGMTDAAISKVEIAFTAGVTPMRTMLKT
jgi:hypothetical protein